MSSPFNEQQLAELKAFVSLCKSQPLLLHHPKLEFFKDYLRSLGVTIPPPTFGATPTAPSGDTTGTNDDNQNASSDGDEDSESDVELDMEGVIESKPLDEFQDMGDEAKEITEEDLDASDEKRSAAMKAFSEQQYDEAIKLYTEAIQLNPQSALMFAKRGQVYLKLNKLLSCIKDCTHALELNCDSAAAYKFRGRAYRLLGKFEEASHDLCESLKIDYDDQTNEWLHEVKPNAEKLRQHKLSAQRNKEEKEHREKLRKARKAQEARARAAKAQAEATAEAAAAGMGGYPGRMPGGFPGGMPGGFPGGMPGGAPDAQPGAGQADDSSLFASLLMDPEIMATIQDPEVSAAFRDVSENPANFVKYQNNPRVAKVIQKLQNILGKGAPGSGGFGGGPNAGSKPSDDDVGLD